MAFVCMSPADLLRDDVPLDAAQHPADDIVQDALNAIDMGAKDKLVLCLPGGGIAAPGVGRNPEMAVVGPFVAVLSGSLQNYAYLVRKYCLEDLALPPAISLEAIRERTPIREAALVCKLYERLGTGMLTKLRGKFAFCLYDSSTRRVLAARDPSGEVPLCQGRADKDLLFLACGEARPQGAHRTADIAPGQFVYGWGADPKKYANPAEEVEKHATQAVGAASMALKGIKLKPDAGKKPGGRRSLDSLRRSSSDKPQVGHRRMSVDAKGSVSPDVDSWRKAKGGRRQRRNSAHAKHDEGQKAPESSQDSNQTGPSEAKGSVSAKDEKKTKAKPPHRGRRFSNERKVKAGSSAQESIMQSGGNTTVDCPVPVAPVH